jgi:hypothetical protein
MSEKKINLIAQLLAKAESTTPEEAEALTEAAQKLMAKFMIDQATIDAKRGKLGHAREAIVREAEQMAGSYQKPMMDLWHTVGQAYGPLRFLKSNGKNVINFYIIGHESDVEQFRALGKSLEIQCTVAMRAWWLANKTSYDHLNTRGKWEARAAFITGFARGAARRMAEGKRQAISEAGPGTELVLADRSAAVEEYFEGLGSRKGRAGKGYYDGEATNAGYRAGQQANTGQGGTQRGIES